MNKKALSLAITLAMAFPAASHALGLGDIQSNSHLNQPFKGKIPVLSATPAEAKNLRVKIASPAVFNRVGIDRPAFLNSIRFRPVIENGKPVILVSSTQPIHEPFVNFLLEVNWPKGQLLKEYTALLDPPVLMQPGTAVASNRVGVRAEPGAERRVNRPAAAQQPRRAQPQRRIVRAPAPQARRAAPPQLTELQRAAQALGVTGNRTAARANPARGTKTYRVKRGDYLYKVAKKLGYRGVRNEQMMMALFEANPQAFNGSNVNNLKSGALMRRPTAQQARGITYRAAKKQLASHTQAWKQNTQVAGKSTSPTRVVKNTQGAPSTTKSDANNQARMVVSGSDGAKVKGSGAAGSAAVSDLREKLVLASESLTSKTNENSELKSRVAELESLLRKKNRLITLKSEQLAELQAKVGGAEITPNAEPETEVVQTEEPISTEVAGAEGQDLQAQVANQNANANGEIIRTAEPEVEPEVEAPVAVTPKPEVKQKPQPEDAGILGLLGDPMVTGIGGGSLLALLGGLWFMRRRKNNSAEDDDEYSDFALDQELAKNAEFGDDDLDLGLDQSEVGESDFTEADFGVEEGMFGEQAAPQTGVKAEEEVSVESKEENILQEADVYLVYGLHDQAEAELRKAIEEEPNNLAYRAKLIENFKAAGDKKNFEKEVKAFKALDGDNKEKLWNDITGWGKSFIPDSNLFTAKTAAAAGAAATAAGVAITAGNASPEENVDVDFPDEVESEIENIVDTDELEELGSVLDDDFSIDIDDMLDDEIVTKDAVGDVTEAADGLDMNFDNSLTDLNVNQVADDVIETDISDSLDLDLGLDDAVEDLSEDAMEVDLDSALDISNFETDLGAEAIATEAEKAEDTMDGLDLDFDLGLDDALDDNIASAKESVSEAGDEKLDMPNLNLDIDSKDFDKIMPENHAYKKVEEVAEKATEAEDNLLADFDDNLSFLDLEEDSGEVIEETQIGTKLDLAKAYIDMGDIEGARSTLEEVIIEGNDEQKKEAEELLHSTG